jgi:hypothetical protein
LITGGFILRALQGIMSSEIRWAGRAPKEFVRLLGKPLSPTAQFLAETKLPRFAGAKTPKEEAIGLLRIAAEVEHALMVQYLYAAYSLADNADPMFSTCLRTVAKEEMGHLVTVQNLLMLLGKPPHLDRDDLLPASGTEPLPFALEPVSPTLLAKYTLVEAPLYDDLGNDYKRGVDKAIAKIPQTTREKINRVGALYTMLYWLFQPTDNPEGPWKLDAQAILQIPTRPSLSGWHVGPQDFVSANRLPGIQATAAEWKTGGSAAKIYVMPAVDKDSALDALYHIAAQGEGLVGADMQQSHFQRYLAAFEAAEQNAPPIRNIPSLPNTQKSASSIPKLEAGRIKTEAGLAWARVFNLRYAILLALIDLTLRLDRNNAGEATLRSKLAQDAVSNEMLLGIGATATLMVALPGTSPTGGPVPPPFELPAGAWPQTSASNIQQLKTELRSLIGQCGSAIATLRAIGDLGPTESDHIDTLGQNDQTLLDMLGLAANA